MLERIKETAEIFFAESDRPWILEGANVHVSMVGFGTDPDEPKMLDGDMAPAINSDLTTGADVTKAELLSENSSLSFIGTQKSGSFDIPDDYAQVLLKGRSGNPHGRPNSDVILPFMNGKDITSRRRWCWIIDFGFDTPKSEAAKYEAPFEYVKEHVYPERRESNQKEARENWWLLWCARKGMRSALTPLGRFMVTPAVGKHRVFSWLHKPVNPDHQLIVFPREDDYFFGVLHSRVHEVWARSQGTQLRERESGFRYTPTTCFRTFPFPWPPGDEDPDDPRVQGLAEAAGTLCEQRQNWLYPDEYTETETLEFPASVDGPWARYVEDAGKDGIGTARYERTVVDPPFEDAMKKRTLTNLYNEMPTWLENAHEKLDEAVFNAYAEATGDPAWSPDMSDEDLLEKLLELNLERASE